MMIAALLAACGVSGAPAALLERIVAVESGGVVLAMNVNGDSQLVRPPRDLSEAVAMARWLLEHGYNFDAGIAQINSANFARLNLTAETVFDACRNLRAAEAVLRECRARALARFGDGGEAERAALSCYNTGDFTRGIQNGYVAAVLAAAGGRLARRAQPHKIERLRAGPRALGRHVVDVFGE